MLKELFEASFYSSFQRVKGKMLMLDEYVKTGAFSLVDAEACRDCKHRCKDEERVQLKLFSKKRLNIISINQVFSYIKEPVGEICDYMIESLSCNALIEMTCITADYVKDKRVKARRQLRNTVSLLYNNVIIRSHIEGKTIRYAVFSWKDSTPINDEEDSVGNNMIGMAVMADEVYSPYNESEFDYGYVFREIRYPFTFEI